MPAERNIYDTIQGSPSPERDLFVPDFEDARTLEGLTPSQLIDITRWTAGALNTQIERRKQADERAMVDKLTGLKSKRAYDDTMARLDAMLEYHYASDREHAERRAVPDEAFHLTAAFVDLDNFGQVNKRYSMDEGDKVLVRMAHALANALRPGDEIYRRGGDEFIVFLLGELDDDSLQTIKGRLKSAAQEAIDEDAVLKNEIGLGASIGIGRSMDGENATQFINRLNDELNEDKKHKTITHKK